MPRREKYERGQIGPEVEYAVSGRATCKTCLEKIANQTLRVGHTAWSGEGIRGGFNTSWYHLPCFPFFTATTVAEDLTGYSRLKADDQELVREKVALKNPEGGQVGASTRRRSSRVRKPPPSETNKKDAKGPAAKKRKTRKT